MQALIAERGRWDRAQLLIDEYGDDAEHEGLRLAAEAAVVGDAQIERVWLEAVPLVPLVRERGLGRRIRWGVSWELRGWVGVG
jgi:hypothetical protein